MTEIKNPDLIRAIRVLAISDNPKTRAALYDALLKSTLLLPVDDTAGQTGEVAIRQGADIALIQSQTSDGSPLLLAFTDADALRRWKSDQAYIRLHAAHLFPILAQHHAPMLMLNIAGPVGGEVTDVEIQLLGQGLMPGSPEAVETRSVTEDSPVGIAPLKHKPSSHLVSQLRQQFAGYPEISSAYLFMLKVTNQPPEMVAGIEFDIPPDPVLLDHIMRHLASMIPPAVIENELSFVPLAGEMLDVVKEITRPVYQRK